MIRRPRQRRYNWYNCVCVCVWHQVAGLVPNVEVCDILLRQSAMNFSYKMYIMKTMKAHRIRANASFIEQLECDIAYARKMIVKKVNTCDCPAVTAEFIEHVYASVFCTTADFIISIFMGEVQRALGGCARMLAVSFLQTLSDLGTAVKAVKFSSDLSCLPTKIVCCKNEVECHSL